MKRFLKASWRVLGALIAPSAAVREPENRRRVLLLNTLLLIYLVTVWGMLGTILFSRAPRGFTLAPPQTTAVVATCAVLFTLFFLLAKTRRYIVAGVCFCLTIDLGILAAVLLNDIPGTNPGSLPFLVVPVLIAMFVLPLRAVLSIGLVSLLSAVVVMLEQAEVTVEGTFAAWFFFAALALVVAGSLLRSFDIKQMEDERLQLFHAARMATLGEMAGSMAHEINNPVAVIQLRASQALRVLKQKQEDTDKVAEFLEAIKRTASHIENVVRSLRSFSRSGIADPFAMTPVRTIISETLGLCEEHLRHVNVEVRVVPFDESLVIECRSVQISQILLNLLSNARSAVMGLPERWVQIAVDDKGASVALSVTDSGPGIPPAITKKIFEPFFTTKEHGLGTGIGLSISANLAKHHNGSLSLDSQSRHTRFILELPKRQPGGQSANT